MKTIAKEKKIKKKNQELGSKQKKMTTRWVT